MATIGSLAVNITATTSQFSAGLNKARAKLNGFANSVTSQLGNMQTVMGGFLAGTAATFVKSTIDQASALQDAADKIGITTEALQKLRFAAGQTGTSTDALERSLVFLNKTMGNAKLGNQEAIDSFKLLGLTVEDLKGKSADQMFLAIVDAINKMPDPAERTAMAMKLLGRGGAELLPLINQGVDGITKMGDELELMGGLIKGDTVKSLEELGDKIEKMVPQFRALSTEIVGSLGPYLNHLLDDTIFKLTYIAKLMKIITSALDRLKSVKGWTGAAMPGFPQDLVKPKTTQSPPAAAVDQKQVVKNTGTTNEKLDQVIEELRKSHGSVQLAPAGVR